MNRWLKIGIALVIFGIIGAGLGYQYIYNKPHRDYERARPDFRLTCVDLYNAYAENRREADKKYTGKILELEGVLTSIEMPDSLSILVFAFTEGLFGEEGIRLSLLPKYHDQAMGLLPGEIIKLKGFCVGYNDTDVILEKGSIIPL